MPLWSETQGSRLFCSLILSPAPLVRGGVVPLVSTVAMEFVAAKITSVAGAGCKHYLTWQGKWSNSRRYKVHEHTIKKEEVGRGKQEQ